MGRKRIPQLTVFALTVLLAVSMVGFTGCSCGEKSETNEDTTPVDVPLMTAAEARGLVYQYLDSRLEVPLYRSRLNSWGGNTGGVYAGQHKWNVYVMGLGTWSVYERTGVVTPSDLTAQQVAQRGFK